MRCERDGVSIGRQWDHLCRWWSGEQCSVADGSIRGAIAAVDLVSDNMVATVDNHIHEQPVDEQLDGGVLWRGVDGTIQLWSDGELWKVLSRLSIKQKQKSKKKVKNVLNLKLKHSKPDR